MYVLRSPSFSSIDTTPRTDGIQWVGNTFESNPDLTTQLRTQDISTLVMCGIQSEYCVRGTSLGALAAGFNVILLQGAHSTYDDAGSGKSATQLEVEVEEELKAQGAVVVPWEKWLKDQSDVQGTT